jgi:hypothetical protein
VLRVGSVLHAGQRLRVVLDPEVRHSLAAAPEVGHERVVGVQHEAGPAVEAGDELGPAVGQQLELPVAVELVAEQVRQQQEARLYLVGHARQPGLVHLEQAELAGLAAGVEQRRGHAPRHVRAGAVVHHRAAGALEAGGDHRRGGRLAVRGRQEHRAGLDLTRHPAQRPGREAQQQPARRGGAAAASTAAAGGPHETGEAVGEAVHQPGPMTRRTRVSTRMVAGVAPIGSPSA